LIIPPEKGGDTVKQLIKDFLLGILAGAIFWGFLSTLAILSGAITK
jgi:hypothetical protein